MPRKPRSAAERRAENQFQLDLQRIVSRGRIWQTAFRTAGAVVVSYFIYKAIEAMAGTTTVADLGLRLVGSLRVSIALAWVLAAGSTTWAVVERVTRQRYIRKFAPRIRLLEKKVDSRRSSSGLDPTDDPPSLG